MIANPHSHLAHDEDDDSPFLAPDDEQVRAQRLEAIAVYERAWGLLEEDAIRADLERCWTPHSRHVNPFTDTVRGIDGLTRLILDFPAMFPGAIFELSSAPDIHHDVARFSWRLRSSTSIRILGRDFGHSVVGVDYVQFDQDNRISQVIAFYGPLKPRSCSAGVHVSASAGARTCTPCGA